VDAASLPRPDELPAPRVGDSAPIAPVTRVVHRPTIVHVVVTAVHDDRVEVKLADGRLGVVDGSDFRSAPMPSVGDELEAAVLARSDSKRVWLSHSWAAKARRWERLSAARSERAALAGTVVRVVKGGAVVDLDGQRAFLPASLADERPVDLQPLVGTIVEVTVIELDEAADRVVVSRREVLRKERRRQQREVLGSLEVGRVVGGVVVGIRDFGAQVDLGGGVRGLIHRSELTWGRPADVADVVAVGEHVEAVVTEVQRSKKRVALSIRRMTPDPLDAIEVGHVGEAEVTRVVEYGAFARFLEGGAEGLIHQSELSELPGARADELVAPGDVVVAKVIDLDLDRRRMGLSVRQALLS
jgi:ribosomal protein S1